MAIPINELRIGNMFWKNYGGYKIVTAIGFNNVGEFPNHLQGKALNGTISGLFDCDKIAPIPLTPEILMACGFSKGDKGFFLQPEFENIYYRMREVPGGYLFSKGFFDWNDELVIVKYLHTFQNAYFAIAEQEIEYSHL